MDEAEKARIGEERREERAVRLDVARCGLKEMDHLLRCAEDGLMPREEALELIAISLAEQVHSYRTEAVMLSSMMHKQPKKGFFARLLSA